MTNETKLLIEINNHINNQQLSEEYEKYLINQAKNIDMFGCFSEKEDSQIIQNQLKNILKYKSELKLASFTQKIT